jgi:hypothetical protein
VGSEEELGELSLGKGELGSYEYVGSGEFGSNESPGRKGSLLGEPVDGGCARVAAAFVEKTINSITESTAVREVSVRMVGMVRLRERCR